MSFAKNVLGVAAPVASVMVGCIASCSAKADSLNVQNFSFENPVVNTGVLPVSLTADYWMLNGSGDVATVPGFGTVAAGVGIFPNPSPTTRGHLTGMQGNQAAYIFSDVGNEISQGLASAANTNVATTFTSGVQYTLTLSLADAQAMPPPTDQLLIGLYYLDSNNNRQEVLTQTIQSGDLSQAGFADRSGFSGILAANDAGIGKQIFVHLTSLNDGGGEFDVDNVRVTTTAIPDVILPHGQILDLSGNGKTVVSISDGGNTGGGVVTNNGGGATQLLFLPNALKTFTGVIQDSDFGGGTIGVIVNGSGTQILSGPSTYSGQTTVLTGTLVAGTNSIAGGPGAFGSSLSPILLGNTSGTSFAKLLIGGAFTVGQDLTVQAGSTGSTTLGTLTDAPGTFTGSVTLNNDLTIVSGTSAAGSVKFAGPIGGGGSVTVAGPGSVILTASNNYSGSTTVNAGALVVAPVNGSASVNSLTVNGGVAHISGTTTLAVNGALSINGGQVDVDRGMVVVNYGGNPSPAGDIRNAIISGAAGGVGIVSSAKAAHPGTTVGYVDANDNAPTATNLPVGSVAFGYALEGDTGLRGTVDLQDYLQLAAHFHELGSAKWSDGDFNYDGHVDLQDYLLLAKNFHAMASTALKPATLSGRSTAATSSASSAASPAVAVPAGLVNPGIGNLALEVDPTNGHVYLVGNSVVVSAYNSDSANGLFNISAGKNPYATLKANNATVASWNVLEADTKHIAENVTLGTTNEPFAAFGSSTGNYYFDLTLAGSTLWTGTSAQVSTDLAFDWGDGNLTHHIGQVINIVPEPTTLSFVIFGAAGLLSRRRRTRVA